MAWFLAAFAVGSLFGQGATPSPGPAAKPKFGNLRFWNMQPIGSPTLELVLASTDPQGRILQTAPPVNYYAGYVHLPPGPYAVKVCRAGNRDNPVKSFNLSVRNNGYLTILAGPTPDGPLDAELIDDTPDPAKPPVNQLTVRQLCPTARVQASTAGGNATDLLEFGRVQVLRGLPGGLIPISTRATLSNGTVKTWTSEADFRNSRHASLLVFTDPYGRIRPRVTVDGPSPADEDAAAAEAVASAPTLTP